jgi:quinol monooxygenase YgiN
MTGIPAVHAKTTKNSFVLRNGSMLVLGPVGRPISARPSREWLLTTHDRTEESTVSDNEPYELRPSVPIIRVFKARANQGCERALADKLATSSVEVVQDQPGFLGYLVAGPANERQHEFISASIWADADAVKARFGEQWRFSPLPPGYAELIEQCSIDHYHLTGQSLGRRWL